MENANIKAVCWLMENGNLNKWRESQEGDGSEKGSISQTLMPRRPSEERRRAVCSEGCVCDDSIYARLKKAKRKR